MEIRSRSMEESWRFVAADRWSHSSSQQTWADRSSVLENWRRAHVMGSVINGLNLFLVLAGLIPIPNP